MKFPDTIEEFLEQYGFIDKERIYTNGSELIPVFRVKQAFEYYNRLAYDEGYSDGELHAIDNIMYDEWC